MPQPKYFTSWSFSRWVDYTLCPLKAKLAHITKIREPKNDAMVRGAAIHDQARDYIRGTLKKLPIELKPVKAELDFIKKLFKKKVLGAIVEEDWAFTKDWNQTQWNDWTGCVLRVKLDAAHYEDDGDTLVVTDWKTGKFRETDVELYLAQLELYALATFMLLPHVMEVKPRLVYTDLGISYPPKSKPLSWTRNQVDVLKKTWAKRVKSMMSDRTFAPRPNDKCRWCFYGQSGKIKGGPNLCKF